AVGYEEAPILAEVPLHHQPLGAAQRGGRDDQLVLGRVGQRTSFAVLAGIDQRTGRNERRGGSLCQLEHDVNIVGRGVVELQTQFGPVVVAQVVLGEPVEVALQVLELFQEGEEQHQVRRPVRARLQNAVELFVGQHLTGNSARNQQR